MDGSLHTVVLLNVKLGQLVVLKDTGFLDITGGGLVDDGTDQHALNGLVLGHGLAGVGASVLL